MNAPNKFTLTFQDLQVFERIKFDSFTAVSGYWIVISDNNVTASDVNTSLDGNTFPRWKIGYLVQTNNFLPVKMQQAISGTSAATYEAVEPHYAQNSFISKWMKV